MIKHAKSFACLLTALLLAGCAGSAAPTPTTARYRVALIAKSTSTEFWGAVFAGAEAAATEYNMDLTITGPESEEDYAAQNDLIEKAVEDGAQAIIFSASDYQQNAAAIDATETIWSLSELHNANLAQLPVSKRQPDNLRRLFDYIEAHPIITLRQTADALALSYNTVATGVKKLVALGILQETTNASRNRVFAYEDYLAILRQDT